MKLVLRFALLAPVMIGLSGCFNFLGLNSNDVQPAERQLPASTQALLAIKGMKQEAPIFVRIFKEESELEVWKLKDGRFQLFRTYPICAWSGGLGPKVQQGDMQAPEGFYTISRSQMNPHSLYHLAVNIGYPNAYDHANGHTGSALMIHGNCKSAGCYAMTDAYIEEIYILAREAFDGGQAKFHVQALPFRMTEANMQRHQDSPWYPFWVKLKEGYDSFEAAGRPPVVKVCSKQYLVNVKFSGQASDPSPEAPCPVYAKIDPAQLPGIEGVPTTAFASLSKPETPSQPPAAPPVAVATALPSNTPKPSAAPAPTAVADMSASSVITRPGVSQGNAVASLRPAKVTPAPAAATPKPLEVRATPVRVAAASSAQPVSYQVGAPFAVPAPVSEPVSKAVDPDALQKPNRSGKGGKLSAAPAAPQDPSTGNTVVNQSPSAGTNSQR